MKTAWFVALAYAIATGFSGFVQDDWERVAMGAFVMLLVIALTGISIVASLERR